MGKPSTPAKPPAGKRTPRREAVQDTRQTKKQIAHGKRQARQQLIILLSLVALGVVIVGIAIAAVVNVVVMKQRQAAATVDGTAIRQSDLVALTNVRRANLQSAISQYNQEIQGLDPNDSNNQFLIQFYQQQVDQMNTELTNIEQSSLEELIDDALIQEKATQTGLSVSASEVQQSIDKDLAQVFATPTPPVTPTETVATATPVSQSVIDSFYATSIANMNVSDKAFRAILRRSLLRTKVQDLLASEVPTTGLVAHVQLIQTDTEDKAIAAEQRVKNGEDFAVVAREVSSDTLVQTNGGDLSWQTPDQLTTKYGQEVETLAFATLNPGDLGRTTSNGKFYVVRLVEKDENGPLPADVLSAKQSSALTDWLAERKASSDVKIERLMVFPTPTPTPSG
jgi:parvulin-like peptidyl-prolyl isomerase